jgi:hypothetical protein
MSEHAEGTPVGRRVFLGMLGLGAAGIVWGSGVSDALSRFLRPITEHDGTGLSSLLPAGGRFRYYSVVGFSPSRTACASSRWGSSRRRTRL